jgi:hypothetical protein
MLTPSPAQVVPMHIHTTRETWLLAAVDLLTPLFAAKVEKQVLGDWEEM